MDLSTFCDVVILIGAFLGAVTVIWKFFLNSGKGIGKKYKDVKAKEEAAEEQRIQAVVNKMMPDILLKHDLETREKYLADRQNYLNEIKAEVAQTFENDISVVYELKAEVAKLSISAKDVLREKIMKIYFDNRNDRTLTEHEKEALEQYYKDYKALNGNSYIDRYYNRMIMWNIIPDDYEE